MPDNTLIMFILEALLTWVMLFFGYILNGLKNGVERVNVDLKELNDAVLGKYLTRDEADARAKAQRDLDHELRALITNAMIDIAKVAGKPYDYGTDQRKGV